MGNATSWSAWVLPDRKEVVVNLSHFRGYLPYEFEITRGTFELPFNLGSRTLMVGDFIPLAQRDVPAMARVDVRTEQRHRIRYSYEIGEENVVRLSAGMRKEVLRYSSQWKHLGRHDTDLGVVIVEARVQADVDGLLSIENAPSGWFKGGGHDLVGRAEGSVVIFVRARFETEGDRRSDFYFKLLVGLATLVPIVMLRITKSLVHRRGGNQGRSVLRNVDSRW